MIARRLSILARSGLSGRNNLTSRRSPAVLFCRAVLFSLALVCGSVQADNQRVISIDGSITEIVYALGQQGRLVGVDTTSRYPAEAQQLPQVGYMRQLSVEGILSLQPELILTSEDAGPASVFEQLQAAGITIVRTPKDYSLEGVLNKVDVVAKALGQPATGNALKQQIEQQARTALARIPAQPAPSSLFCWAQVIAD